MKSRSSPTWNLARFDARAFAKAQGQLNGQFTLSEAPRLLEEAHGPNDESVHQLPVMWSVRGEMRDGLGSKEPQVWLYVAAKVELPLRCQRCLGPVMTALQVDRWFRFVADELTASVEDEGCEEDLLALEPKPHLLEVMEDEFLMELPLIVMHEVCPGLGLSVGKTGIAGHEQELVDSRKNPFEVLQALKQSR